ncbi:MAG TPA: tetratricopeptide repeat protein [Anaeromyxobacteraceae bacterium]|nr:tetratricopeptide repeat protein [Anaeromyxobacteraceae bacterium]
MGALADALGAIRRGDAASAEPLARAAAAEAPGDPRAVATLALALALARRPREALGAADAGARGGEPWALLVRSAVLREAGRAREAAAAAEAALRAGAGAPGELALALAFLAAGAGGSARAPLDRARAAAPGDPLVLRLLGEVELRRDPAAAEALFRASLRADPRGADARSGLARALARQGRAEEAEEVFAVAALQDPSLAADREARRRGVLAMLQAAVVAFLALLAIQMAQGLAGRRWPGARGVVTTLSFVASAVVPAGLLAWATVRLRRARLGGPVDPQIPRLADAVAEAGAVIGGETGAAARSERPGPGLS